ncbi:MAG: DoxX family protein [Anaerolineae bacterium]
MATALWIAQILLAVMFMMVGAMKLMRTKEQMASVMGWVEDFSQGQIRGIGMLEILGALGAVLPALTGILPVLTPLAAVGLALVMVGAALTHLRRKEYGMIAMNAMLFALAVFVAYGRFVLVPLA